MIPQTCWPGTNRRPSPPLDWLSKAAGNAFYPIKFHNLRDLYLHELRDLFSSANQLVDALTRMNEGTTSDDLREAFTDHLDEAQS